MADTPDTLRLKPAPDRRVRHPHGALLDPRGETLPASPYWLRRLTDGDVVEVEAARTSKAKD
ncbi:DUF2635 domain-containing protein [Reyranella sp.]|uniref:DUF2635 domain-containing protein n=1 Tax=Reyranella sp. TaxID=1929291 RepID=UPI00272F908A|nr:DUF2635 domain-containing protein [Reyranella sp.]MDP2373168.1 DUF2635 domain-containing protein [Reyranella sp.]